MKKILIIALSFNLIAPFIASFIWLKYEQNMIRKEVKKKLLSEIDYNELSYFAFTKSEGVSDIFWEHSNEFEYQGEMYDVIKKIYRSDSVFLWCWHDAKETLLNKKLHNLVLRSFGNPLKNQQKHQSIGNLYKIIGIYNPKQYSDFKIFTSFSHHVHIKNCKDLYKTEILSPPPEYKA